MIMKSHQFLFLKIAQAPCIRTCQQSQGSTLAGEVKFRERLTGTLKKMQLDQSIKKIESSH